MGTTKLDRDIAWDTNVINSFTEAAGELFTKADHVLWDAIFNSRYINNEYSRLPDNVKNHELGADIDYFNSIYDKQKVSGRGTVLETHILSAYYQGKACDEALYENVKNLRVNLIALDARAESIKNLLTAPDIMKREGEIRDTIFKYSENWNRNSKKMRERLEKMSKEYYGKDCLGVCYSGDPVNLATGNFIYDHKDMEIKGDIELCFHRFYNSLDRVKGSMGRCFTHNYEMSVIVEEGNYASVRMADGKYKNFAFVDGNYIADGMTQDQLYKKDENYILKRRDGFKTIFDSAGKLIRQENRVGNGISFTYYSNDEENTGMLKQAISDNKSCLKYCYENGLLVLVVDNAGRKVKLEYENGRLDKVTNPMGDSYSYEYSDNGRVTEVTNTRDVVAIVNSFDEKNRVTHQDFPDGGTMDFAYNDDEGYVVLTERNGSVIKYVHDTLNRITDTIFEDGTSIHNEYNSKNQIVSVKDRKGNITKYAYDDRGNTTKKIDAEGTVTNITYNSANQVLVVKVNGKEKLKNSYDSSGKLIKAVLADGSCVEYTYAENRLANIMYPDGSCYSCEYDDRGNIVKASNGRNTFYEYDDLNRVVATYDGNKNKTIYEYDNANRIIKTVDALGNARKYEYNGAGMVTKYTDFDGHTVEVAYNSIGKVSEVKDKEGNSTYYNYDKMWNTSEIINPDGGRITHEYDKDNRLVSMTYPEGGTVCYSYDANGNIISMVDPMGNITKNSFDSLNRVVKTVDPTGAVFKIEYNEEGQTSRTIDRKGNVTDYSYDELGRCISKSNSMGEVIKYEYDGMNRLVKVVYPYGGELKQEFLNGMLTKVVKPDGSFRTFEYDANGNCISICDNSKIKTLMEYDCLNRMVKVINPKNSALCYKYSAGGQLLSITDALGHTTRYTYTPNGRVSQVIDAKGNISKYFYDCMGQLVVLERYGKDSDGEEVVTKTKYEWNLDGKLLKHTDALGNTVSYSYDKSGRMTTKIDQEGLVTTYEYDSRNLTTGIKYADGQVVKFSYDALKLLEEIKDSTGTTKIIRDSIGQIIKTIDSYGKEISYELGVQGEKKKMLYPDGKAIFYNYGENGKLSSVDVNGVTISYCYDDFGRLSEKTLPNGVISTFSYDSAGKVTKVCHKGENIHEEYSYMYDAVGNKIAVDKVRNNTYDNGHFEFKYDELGFLTDVLKDGVGIRRYGYDVFGNRIFSEENGVKTTYSYNENNQLVSCASSDIVEEYEYDMRGNLVKVHVGDRVTREYTFNAANRMSKSIDYSKEKPMQAEYSYNGLGYRVSQIAYDYNPEVGEIVALNSENIYTVDLTNKYYNLLHTEEIAHNNELVAKDYYWDMGISAICEDATSSYYINDDMGSPMEMLDEAGRIKGSYGYDEFGKNIGNCSDNQIFGYVGFQRDDVAGMYFAQARRYDSRHGRFISKDVIPGNVFNPVSLNRYVYCWNKPLDMVDLDGRSSGVLEYLARLAVDIHDKYAINPSTWAWEQAKDMSARMAEKYAKSPSTVYAAEIPKGTLPSDAGLFNPESGVEKDIAELHLEEGYVPVHDEAYYNTREYCMYTNCYAYALGMLMDFVSDAKFEPNGINPGQLNGPVRYPTSAYKDGSEEGKTRILQCIQDDLNLFDMAIVPYEEGMTGGFRISIVIRPNSDYHFYYYNEEDKSWWNKNGSLWVTNNYMRFVDPELVGIDAKYKVPIYESGKNSYTNAGLDERIIYDYADAGAMLGYTVDYGEFYIIDKALLTSKGKCIS